MKSSLSISIVGVGGYGKIFLGLIRQSPYRDRLRLTSVVQTRPERRRELMQEAQQMGATHFLSLDEMLSSGPPADLVILSTGYHEHAVQSVAAMQAGSHVLCEKPVAATIQDCLAMKEASLRFDKKLAIGYQHIFSKGIQELKQRILAGDFGRLVNMKYASAGIRDSVYYSRNKWAGKLRSEGQWILDSPVQNCEAHALNLMLFLAGKNQASCSSLARVKGELYRAFPIESYDTASLELTTDSGCAIKYNVTLACEDDYYFDMHIVCESATIRMAFDAEADQWMLYIMRKGEVCESLPVGLDEPGASKLDDTIEAIEQDRDPKSSISNSLQHVIATNGAIESCPEIQQIPQKYVKRIKREGESFAVVVPGIAEAIRNAFARNATFSELDLPWATSSSRWVRMAGYDSFPGAETARKLIAKAG